MYHYLRLPNTFWHLQKGAPTDPHAGTQSLYKRKQQPSGLLSSIKRSIPLSGLLWSQFTLVSAALSVGRLPTCAEVVFLPPSAVFFLIHRQTFLRCARLISACPSGRLWMRWRWRRSTEDQIFRLVCRSGADGSTTTAARR
jgi:hypothetical protein